MEGGGRRTSVALVTQSSTQLDGPFPSAKNSARSTRTDGAGFGSTSTNEVWAEPGALAPRDQDGGCGVTCIAHGMNGQLGACGTQSSRPVRGCGRTAAGGGGTKEMIHPV